MVWQQLRGSVQCHRLDLGFLVPNKLETTLLNLSPTNWQRPEQPYPRNLLDAPLPEVIDESSVSARNKRSSVLNLICSFSKARCALISHLGLDNCVVAVVY